MPKPEPALPTPPQAPEEVPRPGTVAAAGYNPFAALDESKELEDVFKRYPRLISQLLKIEAAMNNHATPTNAKGRSNAKGPLNQDPGLQNGLKELYMVRNSDDGEGVQEFGELILQILAKDDAADAAMLVQKELEEESARYVALLLQAES